jgi:predicted HAD superfamily phosphohydrolase
MAMETHDHPLWTPYIDHISTHYQQYINHILTIYGTPPHLWRQTQVTAAPKNKTPDQLNGAAHDPLDKP